MQYIEYILVFQLLTFGKFLGLTDGKALIGHNIRPTMDQEFPAVACLARYNPELEWNENLLCTATLISANHILTAEHCFGRSTEFQIEVVLEAHDIANGVRYYPAWWICFNQWARNRGEVVEDDYNDILVAKILGLKPSVNSVALRFINPPSILAGIQMTVVGCGRIDNHTIPSVMYTVGLTALNNDHCMDIIEDLGGQRLIVTDKFVCSVGNPYTFLEAGDSGGPLFYEGYLIGINIAVCPVMNNEFHPNKVNFHHSLTFYKQFINNAMELY